MPRPRRRPRGLSVAQVRALSQREITPEDYDMLLRLDEALAKPTASRDFVARLPKVKVKTVLGKPCMVCLENFQKGDKVLELPCKHKYHGKCISRWLLKYRPTCPVCAKDVRHCS